MTTAHSLIFIPTIAVFELGVAFGLPLIPRLGPTGKRLAELSCRAPLLDFWVGMLTLFPWIFARCFGFNALVMTVIGQSIALIAWSLLQEWIHRDRLTGPRIVTFINRQVGAWRNHLALWYTLVALPVFWAIRILEMLAYWPMVGLLDFPKYHQADWVNVSRQKFNGLVAHDLLWCLYCDWMTGVYALGAEILRNVESFWCPIRFASGKKCDNCKLDFPDVAAGWVPADGDMNEVLTVMQAAYGDGHREWFGHPARLTVGGKTIPLPTGGGNKPI